MPRKLSKAKLKSRIIRRLRKMQDELKLIIIDKQWWNENRRDATPFDLGWEMMMLEAVEEILSAWARHDTKALTHWTLRLSELCELDPKTGDMPCDE